MIEEPKVEGFNISYRGINARFRHCRVLNIYKGSFEYFGLGCSWENKNYKDFIQDYKKNVDKILD